MHIKVILSFIVLSNSFLKSSASNIEGLNLLAEAIEIRSNMNFYDLKNFIKEKRTQCRKDTALAAIYQNPSTDYLVNERKKYWEDDNFRMKKLEKTSQRYYKNKKDNNEENNNNNLKSNLSDEALSIAAIVDINSVRCKTNVSNSSIEIPSEDDENLQKRINRRKEISVNKIREFSTKFSIYDKKIYDKLKYWMDDEARELKLKKMREKYAQKKALLSNQSSNN